MKNGEGFLQSVALKQINNYHKPQLIVVDIILCFNWHYDYKKKMLNIYLKSSYSNIGLNFNDKCIRIHKYV